MKSIKYIYQENEIHFLVHGNDKDVMINATEMAKVFDKRIDFFMKSDHVKAFINELEFTPYGGNSAPLKREEILQTKGKNGTYFCRPLALKFAAWIDVKFELWVYTTLDEIIFGNYKKHWEAHAIQEQAKVKMMDLKKELFENPTTEMVKEYFEAEKLFNQAKIDKTKAIKNQLSLF